METAEIQFYELLKRHNFNSEDAEKFVGLQKEMQTQHLATKEDLRDVKAELTAEIAEVKAGLTMSIAQAKTAITWRVFIFWLAQIGVLLGIAYKVFSV